MLINVKIPAILLRRNFFVQCSDESVLEIQDEIRSSWKPFILKK